MHSSLQPAGPCALQAASILALAKLDCQTTHATCLSFAGREMNLEQAANSVWAAVTGFLAQAVLQNMMYADCVAACPRVDKSAIVELDD